MCLQDAEAYELTHKQEAEEGANLSSRSLKDLDSHARRTRSEEYMQFSCPAKQQSKVSVDKVKWDGPRSSFPSEVEGNLLMIGMTCMLNQDVQDGFKGAGIDYFKSDQFWKT